MRFADNGPENGGFGNADDSDEDDAMPIIPDLEDVRDEDMQLQVILMNNQINQFSNSITFYPNMLI